MKVYLTVIVLTLACGTTFSQRHCEHHPVFIKNKPIPKQETKAAYDTIAYETFDAGATIGSWVVSNQNDHTNGDWYLETVFPSALSALPLVPFTTFTGASGNYAFINSYAEGAGQFQDALLTSPPIDLSSMGSTGLTLRWTSIWTRYQELKYVRVSNDNGLSWFDFTVSTSGVNTSSTDPEYGFVEISDAKSGTGTWSNQVLIQFRYDGSNDRFWAVDNIAITESPPNDLEISNQKTHFAGKKIEYTKIPVSIASAMEHEAWAKNIGNATQPTTQLDVIVSGAGSFSNSSSAISLAPTSLDKLVTSGITPSAVGTYSVGYNVVDNSTVDQAPWNNVANSSFEITTDTYSKSLDTLDGWWAPFDDDGDGLNDPMEFVPQFDILQPMVFHGFSVVIMDLTPVGSEIYYNLYYNDSSGPQIAYDGLTLPVPTYTVTATDLTSGPGNEVDIYLPFPTTISMLPGATESFYPTVGFTSDSIHLAVAGTASDTSNFLSIFATTAGETNYLINSLLMMAVNTEAAVGLHPEYHNVALGQNMPNPFNSNTVIPFSLVNAATVEFVVTDMMGKIIENRELGTLSNGDHTINFNGSDLASGFYYYSVIVDGKRSTKKFAVAK